MSIKRFLGIALSILMVLAVVPMAALAENISADAAETAKLKLLDDVWAELDAVEADAIASGAEASEVVMAMYKAVLQNRSVDAKSISGVTTRGFFFKVDGMLCGYDYVASTSRNPETADSVKPVEVIHGKKNGPSNMNVLLVGPYYGQDSSFTNQYREEAASIAEVTGGDVTILQSSGATGPAIAAACPDNGVVIYDSHGTQEGTSSYLCLTTNAGITSTDYANGWAVSSGSAAFIDGRYIQNHITSPLPNSLFWMAICEGMKKAGNGTTGTALLDAGAGVVYGYSQSVSFTGDYRYEAHFWNNMKNNDMTVAEAFNAMTAALGNWDPAYSSSSGAAWPIVMSPDDPFPSNPDSHQTVNCDWKLFGGSMEPVALESWSLDPTSVDVLVGGTTSVKFDRIPTNANEYELEWRSANTNIAAVSGNNSRVTITGLSVGSTTVYCDVYQNGTKTGTGSVDVNVTYNVALSQAAQADGCNLQFSTSQDYAWEPVTVDNRSAVQSGNYHVDSSTSSMYLALNMTAGETLSFDWKVSSESNYDMLGFYVNGNLYGSRISGNRSWTTVTYTATTSGTFTFEWRYEKDVSVASGNDRGYVDNVSYTPTAYNPGDINNDGVVDSADALLVLRYSMNLGSLNAAQLAAADVNGDGVVDSSDALLILRGSMNAQ